MAAPVVRDDAIAALAEEQHLPVPVVRAERPAMREHDRLSRAPVLVENLCSVLRGDSGHLHSPPSWIQLPRLESPDGLTGSREVAV